MKYTKPHKAIRWLRGESSQWGSDQEADILAFLDSLPAEFEIVEPGMTQVRWPGSATKRELERLYQTYKNPYPVKFDRPIRYDEQLSTVLHALAEIAPVEKKKRRVELWKNQHGSYTLCNPGFKPVEGLSAWERVRTSCPLEVEE